MASAPATAPIHVLSDELRRALTTEVERLRCAPNVTLDPVEHHKSGLASMNAFRDAVLAHLAASQNDIRLTLSRDAARINRLPDDVFIHIFAMMNLTDLIEATHVCYRWRLVALNTPTLWANSLTATGLRQSMVAELFDRARGAPAHVTLDMRGPPRSLQNIMHLLGARVGTVRSLVINAVTMRDPYDAHDSDSEWPRRAHRVRLNLDNGLSALECLTVSWNRSRTDPYSYWPQQQVDIIPLSILLSPTTARDANFSVLRHVSLRGVLRNPRFLPFCRQLRTLQLDIPQTLALSTLLYIIRENSHLHTLELSFQGGWNVGAPHPWKDVTLAEWVQTQGFVGQALRHIALTGSLGSQEHPWTVILAAVDCSKVPSITFDGEQFDQSHIYSLPVLGHLQFPTRLEFMPYGLRVEDAQGFVRTVLLRSHTQQRLHRILELLPLTQLVTLRLPTVLWNFLPVSLECLCSLTLLGDLEQLCSLRPHAIFCPQLQTVTLDLTPIAENRRDCHKLSWHYVLAVALAFTVARISGTTAALAKLTMLVSARSKKVYILDPRVFPQVSKLEIIPSGRDRGDIEFRYYLPDDSDAEGAERTGQEITGVDWMEFSPLDLSDSD
ncbi:hypothetical protein EXIGLDRAFT_831181 [Exidia glandulosa HHB12029]|uniref:F-box domain-containing protein n=1 Tax=Exidia glandulosa HHB12029 TaxID=1314781 RepID=A0A165MUT4_EXIGL|nr:hypothetical protein EXIGLDRAFT_831181 [Exidia glandulosa HHB12029]